MNKLAYYKKLYKLIKTQQFIEACYNEILDDYTDINGRWA